ncbi:MAG: pirin family protein [Marinagarivorans sp.]|nr:pirin family protein [Marinagarivorans sp.]
MAARAITEIIQARATSDGDGVRLLRVFGGRGLERFDPFLMLDEFGSLEAADYIGGFPPHPHRGFETVTFMLEGKMEHRDHLGNVGLLSDGGVQWMTAAKGIIHSEMPKQTEGRMRGFQLWLNLPAAEKLKPAHYLDVDAKDIPRYAFEGVEIKAIAGNTTVNGAAITGRFTDVITQPIFLDLAIRAGAEIVIPTALNATALVYVYEGAITVADAVAPIKSQQMARFGEGGELRFRNSTTAPARCIVLMAKPLGEPIVQYGPFVMNTAAEIEQALEDYKLGRLTDE